MNTSFTSFIEIIKTKLFELIDNNIEPLKITINNEYSSLLEYYADLEKCLLYEIIYQINRNIKYNISKSQQFNNIIHKNKHFYISLSDTDLTINDLILVSNTKIIDYTSIDNYAIITSHTDLKFNNKHKLVFLTENNNFNSNELYYINCTNLTTFSRIYTTLNNSNFDNKIYQSIIKPNQEYSNKKSRIKPLTIKNKQWNESQSNAIKSIISNSNGLHIIHGPPGTGKTFTLLGIIYNLISKKKIKQLLLTTTCNLTIAELTLKVLTLHDIFKEGDVLVVGQLEHIDSRIQKYCIYSYLKIYMAFFKDLYVTINKWSKQELKKSEVSNDIFDNFDNLFKESEIENPKDSIDKWVSNVKKLYIMPSIKKGKELIKLDDSLINYNKDNILLILDTWFNKDYILKQLLNNSIIVLSTTSSSGSDLLCNYDFKTVIIDEAAQALQSETLICLRKNIKSLILIGDHLQREGFVQTTRNITSNYNKSLMKRYINLGYPIIMLNEQFRMHPEIALFPSRYIYNNKLINSPDLKINNKLEPYTVYNIKGNEIKDQYGSFYNISEIDKLIELIPNYLQFYKEESIVIITPYQSQKTNVYNYLSMNNYNHIKVYTVDDYQGQESEVVFLLTVRTNNIGFLNELSRLNVALTRAKDSFIIICNIDALMKEPHWKELLIDAEKRKLLKNI